MSTKSVLLLSTTALLVAGCLDFPEEVASVQTQTHTLTGTHTQTDNQVDDDQIDDDKIVDDKIDTHTQTSVTDNEQTHSHTNQSTQTQTATETETETEIQIVPVLITSFNADYQAQTIHFNANMDSEISDSLIYRWYINDVLINRTHSGEFLVDANATYHITLEVEDSQTAFVDYQFTQIVVTEIVDQEPAYVFEPATDNLLENGYVIYGANFWLDFDTTLYITAGGNHSGDYSLIVQNRNTSFEGAGYRIEHLLQDNQYQFESWVKLGYESDVSTTQAVMSLHFEDDDGEHVIQIDAKDITKDDSDGNWIRLHNTYVHNANGVTSNMFVKISIDHPYSDFHIDDLSITHLTTEQIDIPQSNEAHVITFDDQQIFQIIDGFGARLTLDPNQTHTSQDIFTLFGTHADAMGLSIANTNISDDSNLWGSQISTLYEAKHYGEEVSILATSYTGLFDINSQNNSWTHETQQDYADHLNDYILTMANSSVMIDLVSVQNNPEDSEQSSPAWTHAWTTDDFISFVNSHANEIENVQLMIGEDSGYQSISEPSVFQNEEASANIDYLGGHLNDVWNAQTHSLAPLNNDLANHSLTNNKWITHWSISEADTQNEGVQDSLIWQAPSHIDTWNETLDDVVSSVHYSMIDNWSAYIWSDAKHYASFIADNSDAFTANLDGQILKRGWAFSQFSKYVRPGYQRVNVKLSEALTLADELLITAYQGDDHKLVFVIINKSETDFDNTAITFPVNAVAGTHTVTSQFLQQQSQPFTPIGQQGMINIPKRSISTVVIQY